MYVLYDFPKYLLLTPFRIMSKRVMFCTQRFHNQKIWLHCTFQWISYIISAEMEIQYQINNLSHREEVNRRASYIYVLIICIIWLYKFSKCITIMCLIIWLIITWLITAITIVTVWLILIWKIATHMKENYRVWFSNFV